MSETYETMMREVARWAYDKPMVGGDEKYTQHLRKWKNKANHYTKIITSLARAS